MNGELLIIYSQTFLSFKHNREDVFNYMWLNMREIFFFSIYFLWVTWILFFTLSFLSCKDFPSAFRVSASQGGYDDVQWNSSSESHPPWLRFHLGITRWELYPHLDPNMELLTQQIATQRIVSAGVIFSVGDLSICLRILIYYHWESI